MDSAALRDAVDFHAWSFRLLIGDWEALWASVTPWPFRARGATQRIAVRMKKRSFEASMVAGLLSARGLGVEGNPQSLR